MTDDERAALLRQMAHSYHARHPGERSVLIRMTGGEPLDAVICITPEAAMLVANAMELQPDDFRIIVAREM